MKSIKFVFHEKKVLNMKLKASLPLFFLVNPKGNFVSLPSLLRLLFLNFPQFLQVEGEKRGLRVARFLQAGKALSSLCVTLSG